MTKYLAALAAFAVATAATPAMADQQIVSFADLDLTTAKGQKTLERRMTTALREVCKANEVRTGTRVRSKASLDCMKDARVKAKAQVAAIIERQNLGG